eukprot:m.115599 g.115599  ORF g.115599 m.115599 type:complete len:62 (+) comp13577_c0_seq1:2741-2926(+)
MMPFSPMIASDSLPSSEIVRCAFVRKSPSRLSVGASLVSPPSIITFQPRSGMEETKQQVVE